MSISKKKKIQHTDFGRFRFKMATEEDPRLTLSQKHITSAAIYGTTSSKNNLKTEQALCIRPTPRQVEESRTQSHRKPHPYLG